MVVPSTTSEPVITFSEYGVGPEGSTSESSITEVVSSPVTSLQ